MDCKSAPTQPSVETDHVRLPTQHGLMVAWGQFAQHIGLVEGLMDVPVPQKMVRHAPQKKLLEFLMAILVGVEYLQDINAGPHPLARDRTVAQGWGQDSLAHYSAVSRTLVACDPETVTAARAVLDAVSRPFIQQAVNDVLLGDGYLTLDLDLMGRSPAGIQLQELFTLFGANFVRWAAVWLRGQTPKGQTAFLQTLDSVKTMVRIAANSPAWLIRNSLGTFLEFAESSRFAGTVLRLAGIWCYQPALPLLRPLQFSNT
jgi:hypothetical protein